MSRPQQRLSMLRKHFGSIHRQYWRNCQGYVRADGTGYPGGFWIVGGTCVKKFAAILFVFLVCTASAWAQLSTNARVGGTVTDPSAAAVPGVKITARNTLTGIVTVETTNASGVYTFPSLQPGTYDITAESSAFQSTAYTGLILDVAAQMTQNFSLQVATNKSVVEVSAAAESVQTQNATVGDVISGQRVNDLPLTDHNVLGLVATQQGVVGSNFAGARAGAVNITLNGTSVQDTRTEGGSASNIYTPIDLVDEISVVTAPADAELGRGSGQVAMTVKSGTNQFHGSLYDGLRNTDLNANTYFNNLNGLPRSILIRNQFGSRLAGPVIRNKTFFFVLYDAQRQTAASTITSTTLTSSARQGLFRFYPGVKNGNAISSAPTVDANGNPVPPTANAVLSTVNLFSYDPNRKGLDPSGEMAKLLSILPLPNNYTVGDGLNTAGYVWNLSTQSPRDDIDFRIDQYVNKKTSVSFSYVHEHTLGTYNSQPFPTSPAIGTANNHVWYFNLSLISTLSPTLVNEVHIGGTHPANIELIPADLPQGKPYLATAGDFKYGVVTSSFTDPMSFSNTSVQLVNPFYSIGDSITKVVGRHSIKVGFDIRAVNSNSYDSTNIIPQATLGAGGAAVTGISTISGIGSNATLAQNMLNDLAGSVNSITQAFQVASSVNPQYIPGYDNKKDWHSREGSWFVKDDFRLRPDLMLNVGVRWEYYSVPWESHGLATCEVGGSAALFGISGTNFSALDQPGDMSGLGLTQQTPCGKDSSHPGQQLYKDDYNNFGPAIGLSWSIPYFGKDKTVLRAGYAIGYERTITLGGAYRVDNNQPGTGSVVTLNPSSYLNLQNVTLPLTPPAPFTTAVLTDRTQTVGNFDSGLRTPYIQNMNVSLERSLGSHSSLALRYVGSNGVRLLQTIDLNQDNIFSNGLLQAFQTTQAGGNAPLFDQMLMGLNLGSGVINGTTVTGSQSLRASTLTQAFFANNSPGGLANFLNVNSSLTGVAGGLLSRAGLPPNFFVVNPQFVSAATTMASTLLVGDIYACNCSHSTYNAAVVEYNKRFRNNWSLLANYTFSKNLGTSDGNTQGPSYSLWRNDQNWSLDKHDLAADHRNVFKASGSYTIPVPRFQKGIVERLLERWQVGAILTLQTGAPLTVTASATQSFSQIGGTASATGAFSNTTGQVTKVGNGVIYFPGLTQIADPSIANITTLQGVQSKSTMLAIASSDGKPLLVNPAPGTMGNLSLGFLTGPPLKNLDMNLVKRFTIRENWNFEFRVDALSVANNAQMSAPTVDINSSNFGRITSAGGNRIMVANLRVSF